MGGEIYDIQLIILRGVGCSGVGRVWLGFRTKVSRFPCCLFRPKKMVSSLVFVYLLVIRAVFNTLGIAPCSDVDIAKLSMDILVSTRSPAVGTRL